MRLFNKLFKKDDSPFRFLRSGRDGKIIYSKDDKTLEIHWEMSGSADADILLAPLDFRNWTTPEGGDISIPGQLELLNELRLWLKQKRYCSDIDLPSQIDISGNKCRWVGCTEKSYEISAFCPKHFDQALLRSSSLLTDD